jgi:hypothetical protein
VVLLIAVGSIIWESISRFRNPEIINGENMILVAGIGIIINTITALLFLKGKEKDLNIKGAYLHTYTAKLHGHLCDVDYAFEYPYKDQNDFLNKSILFKKGLDGLNEKYDNNSFANLIPEQDEDAQKVKIDPAHLIEHSSDVVDEIMDLFKKVYG